MNRFLALFALALPLVATLGCAEKVPSATDADGPTRTCGTASPSEQTQIQVDSSIRRFMEFAPNVFSSIQDRQEPMVVPAEFWVVIGANGAGRISDQQIQQQMEVMNEEFAEIGLRFSLDIDDINHVDDPQWFQAIAGDPKDEQMLQSIQGDDNRMTIVVREAWALDENSEPVRNFGYASYPWDVVGPDSHRDVVVLDWETIPGGVNTGDYSHGDTAVHEAGHWLGLLHTFENACREPGDYVNDTPYQRVATEGCPSIEPDTCPRLDGNDPVKNFMNYASDVCMTEFTVGQAERTIAVLTQYRPWLLRQNSVPLELLGL